MKQLIIILLAFTMVCANTIQAQDMWTKLSKISYKKQYDDMMGFEVDVPVFSSEIMEMEGKEIVVEGFVIPVEGYDMQENFVFSAFPYNMCFFCGNAGPETVMEVYVKKEKVKFTSRPIKLKGILGLNSGDINSLMYILNDAELVTE